MNSCSDCDLDGHIMNFDLCSSGVEIQKLSIINNLPRLLEKNSGDVNRRILPILRVSCLYGIINSAKELMFFLWPNFLWLKPHNCLKLLRVTVCVAKTFL